MVVNEPTPYRLHLLHRFVSEIPEITLHVIFTRSVDKLSVPWQLELSSDLNIPNIPRGSASSLSGCGAWALGGKIADWIVNHRIDAVIVHGYADLARVRVLGTCTKRGIPVFVRGDSNCFDERHAAAWKRWVKSVLLKMLLRRVAGVMPMGVAGRAFFSRYTRSDMPAFLVPYEPDYTRLRSVTAAERQAFLDSFELNPERRRLLYCGRLIPIKRVDRLIRGFADIADERPDWDLVIAGTGPEQQKLQHSVPAHLNGRVHWLGFLQFEDVRRCYAACDVLVHPSVFEPWALVINEAVAAGMAVVATDVTGAAIELVKHGTNGLLIPPDNQAALNEALVAVTQPQTLAAMREQAGAILHQWQLAADPVAGLRAALRDARIL